MTEATSVVHALGIDVDYDYAIPAAVWQRVTNTLTRFIAEEAR